MFPKTLFFLLIILISCSPPDSHLSSESSESLESSRQYFQYELTSCTGQKAKCMNNTKVDDFIDLTVKDGTVHISRPSVDPSANVKLQGSWDSDNGELTGISGKFGIAHTENWELAEGVLNISEETVTGRISGIQIEYAGTNPKCGSGVDTSCSVSLSIGQNKE